jgi:hypothetical protein
MSSSRSATPTDAERFLPMLERQIARCGVPPRQIAADGGYASQDNLKQAKARGVKDVAFHKKRCLAVEDMVRSRWVYRKLRNFAPGSRPGSPASSEPRVWHAAPGAGSITSRPTSGPRWWRTTWCCLPASNLHSRPAASIEAGQITRPVYPCSTNDSFDLCRYCNTKSSSSRQPPNPSPSFTVKICGYGWALVWVVVGFFDFFFA